jgi:mersacidin/lichenicidin family type 2 lantibiotic
MPGIDLIRAWKDEEYRLSLTEAERALIPVHPTGLIQLDEEQLKAVLGQGPGHQPTTTATTAAQYCG